MTNEQLTKICYENLWKGRKARDNQMHQADLLYLPDDNQSTYKYALNVIDVASCLKASRPLKTRKASKVAEMLRSIYKKSPLRYPNKFHVSGGTEFKAGVLKLMKEKGVKDNK